MDPDDSPTRLDIRRIDYRTSRKFVTLRLETWESWGCTYLSREDEGLQYQGGRWSELRWVFQGRSEGNERDAGFHCDEDGKIFLRVPQGELADTALYDFPAHRPDRRTVEVRLPVGHVSVNGDPHTVYAYSEVNGLYGEDLFYRERDVTASVRP